MKIINDPRVKRVDCGIYHDGMYLTYWNFVADKEHNWQCSVHTKEPLPGLHDEQHIADALNEKCWEYGLPEMKTEETK